MVYFFGNVVMKEKAIIVSDVQFVARNNLVRICNIKQIPRRESKFIMMK